MDNFGFVGTVEGEIRMFCEKAGEKNFSRREATIDQHALPPPPEAFSCCVPVEALLRPAAENGPPSSESVSDGALPRVQHGRERAANRGEALCFPACVIVFRVHALLSNKVRPNKYQVPGTPRQAERG